MKEKLKKGFTLIELLIVIAIIGVIIAIAVPSIIYINNNIKNKTYNSKIDTIVSSAELYASNHTELFYGTNTAKVYVGELLNENYLESEENGCLGEYETETGQSITTNGCIYNPIDNTLLNDKYVIVSRSKTSYVGCYGDAGCSSTDDSGSAVLIYVRNASDAVGDMNVKNYKISNGVTLDDNLFTRNKYVFNGWCTDSECNNKYQPGQTLKEELTRNEYARSYVYAGWRPFQYTISYDGNGATSGTTANTTHTYVNQGTIAYNSYVRSGYLFDGWTKKETTCANSGVKYTGGSVPNFEFNDGDVITLCAQWKQMSLTFNNQKDSIIYSTASQNKTIVGATGGGGTIAYSIIGGNTNNYFYINNNVIGITGKTPVGTYYLTVRAYDSVYNIYKDVTITITITSRNIQLASSSLSGTSFQYTGGYINPGVTIIDNGFLLSNGSDYTVYYQNNLNAGTATAVITGIGNYYNSINLTYTIYSPVTYTVTFYYNKAGWNGSSTTKTCTAAPGSGCYVATPYINNMWGSNYRISYSSLFNIQGWNTSQYASYASVNQGNNIYVTGNTSYYAIVTLARNYFTTFTEGANGVFVRTYVGGCSKGLIPAGYGLSVNDFTYTGDGSNPIWLYVNSANNCWNSNCTCYSGCSGGWITATWVY